MQTARALVGRTGWSQGASARYQAPVGAGGAGSAAFSVLLAVRIMTTEVGQAQPLFGSSGGGVDGWYISREQDVSDGFFFGFTAVGALGPADNISGHIANCLGRVVLMGFTYTGGGNLVSYFNGGKIADAAADAVTASTGRLMIGNVDLGGPLVGGEDQIIAAAYTDSVLTDAEMQDTFNAFRYGNRLIDALDTAGVTPDICYDFYDVKYPVAVAPATLPNTGSLGTAMDMSRVSSSLVLPQHADLAEFAVYDGIAV